MVKTKYANYRVTRLVGQSGTQCGGICILAGSNMLTRVHLSIRGGDSGWAAGGHQLFDGGSTGGRGRRGHVRQARDLACLAAGTDCCVLWSRNVDI